MGSEPLCEEIYKTKFLRMCEQRERELKVVQIALLSARKELKPSEAFDSVNEALNLVFDL